MGGVMSRFTNMLIVSPYADGKTWYLRRTFAYDVGEEGSDETIMVPQGFTTDFASIPRIFWTILPRWGKYGNAAVIHDFLYYQQKYNRKEADTIFREAMGVLEVPVWQQFFIYWAVRGFGLFAWRSNKNKKAYWAVRGFGLFAWRSNKNKKAAGMQKMAKQAPLKSSEMPLHWKTRK
jgi:hypothetical protein